MRDYQPWDDSWREQLVYIMLPHEIEAPVEMPSNFTYPIFLDAFERRVGGDDFWKAIAGSMVYVLGHQPGHADAASYIHWLNAYNPNLAKELIYDGAEQFSRNNLESAVWLFQAAVLLDPQRAEAHFNLGLAYNQMGRNLKKKNREKDAESCFRQAVQYLENAVEIDPGFRMACCSLDLACEHLGLEEESSRRMEKRT
ncbi:MAG: tetratricopeptide repeat protein [Peptococcaceae bacterium]|jgi:tetratricopeptide (TPR) repeat protein|nr:tetratricopeptide repeat protein [Peptococcaceae bacterium]MDH7525619.1 tetratricopeptide repeat protein [Peptococcaceae bacterium]